jgi:AcrR family transcriptional regulator
MAIARSRRGAPAQQRSRERLERILAVASAVIAEKGSDQMRMSEVAERAGISIGSLYQYFPDKSAVICALAERYHVASRACIETALAGVRDLPGLRAAFGTCRSVLRNILADPVMRDIWSGMQADKRLVAIELAESRANGALLAAAMARTRPGADCEKLATSAFLIWQLGEAAMRLAISVERAEGDAIVDAYKRMTLRELAQA